MDENLRAYQCPTCGAELITEKTTAATACPYCGNPSVVPGQLSGALKPEFVLPFKVEKDAVVEALHKHYGKHNYYLPRLFRSENNIQKVQGVYVPFWLFDATADARVRYRATKTRVWSDANYNYTSTSFYNLFRSGSLGFEHIPVDGSAKIPHDLMQSLEPFDLPEAVPLRTP